MSRLNLHALNNHLAVICGYSELLTRCLAADDPRRRYAVQIHETARRMAAALRAPVASPDSVGPVGRDRRGRRVAKMRSARQPDPTDNPAMQPWRTARSDFAPAQLRPPKGAETVLLVDDDEQVRDVTAHVLRTLGYTVLEAATGARASELAQGPAGATVQLLITDVGLRDLSGRELAERVREACPAVKTLFFSGHCEAALRAAGLLKPGDAFLAKPYSTDDLAREIRERLDSPRQGNA